MMIKSRLLYFALLSGLTTAGSLVKDAFDIREGVSPLEARDGFEKPRVVIWEKVEYVVVEREVVARRIILERIPETTAPAEGAVANARIPEPTAAPRKRQDSGQVQALSGQIQQLSLSVSLASSASQSISQSAQQVQQSANQAAQENSQAISRTQSSALSAVAQASQQANDKIAQASSSMDSQISRNLASVQSSASNAISVAQGSASASMASVMNVAMSQIQAARAEATAVRSDANNFADQVQRNAISTTNLAIIVSTSVSGAVILTSTIVCVFLRYRRKKVAARDGRSPTPDEKGYDEPIAVRGSVGGSRFNPFNGGNYPLDKLRLPTFTPRTARKEEPLNFGFAMSDYSDVQNEGQEEVRVGNTAANFRLQKHPSIESAEAVRVIRVNSKKEKEQPFSQAVEQSPPVAETPAPTKSERGLGPDTSQPQVARKPIGASPAPVEQTKAEKHKSTPAKEPDEDLHQSKRYTAATEAGDSVWESSRYSITSTSTFVEPSAQDSKRYTAVSQPRDDDDGPGWRPPSSRGASRVNSIKPTEPIDPVPEVDATGRKQSKGRFSMASVSGLLRSESAKIEDRQPTIPKLAKGPRQGPSFTTFPVVRSGPPSVLNGPRPAQVGRSREKAKEGSA